ncbi:MAG: hypothetical protein E6I80_17280 [Chloroflexi bacterium]|nr:MAG: hypothetical protein E6I80_17280 [Chloroflexota bacterium]
MFKMIAIGLAVVATGAALGALYFKVVRPWTMRWGATDDEFVRRMPGDDVVRRADFNATRAVTIHARPEHVQHLAVGDLVPMVPGKDVGIWVKELEPNRRMLWWDKKGEYSWEWQLDPIDDESTRLVTRLRATYPPLWSSKTPYVMLATTGDIVMVRKELLSIKARAERLAATDRAFGQSSAPAGRGMA